MHDLQFYTANDLRLTLSSAGNLNLDGAAEINTGSNIRLSGFDGSTTGIFLNGTLVTASAAEINVLDGLTADTLS